VGSGPAADDVGVAPWAGGGVMTARDDEGLAGDGQVLVGGPKAGNPTAL
jgi:hypothetical protein